MNCKCRHKKYSFRAVVRGNVSLHMRKVHKKEGIAYHDIIRIGDYTYWVKIYVFCWNGIKYSWWCLKVQNGSKYLVTLFVPLSWSMQRFISSSTFLGITPAVESNICIQGDPSRCAKLPVNFKVLFWPGLARPKRNFCFEVNERFWTTWWVTLYM